MSTNQTSIYFAADESNKTASMLLAKASSWYNLLNTNGYLDKLRMLWSAYHGAYYSDFNDGHSITFTGEQGELASIAVNHLRNIAQNMLNMVTATRPSLQARAINTDNKSLVQARLANGLLDYYLREKRLEKYFHTAVEYAIVMGSGYIKMEWNSMAGEIYDYNEETKTEVREGDIEFSNMSPFDVVFDPNREDQKHDWVLCRSFKNRFDLIAKYPEYEKKIIPLPSKSQLQTFHLETATYDKTDLIPVYEFYHKRSESMPDGRYLLFLSDDVILLDSPMPYRDLPVYRIAPSNILGSPYGYTPLFDLLPIQDSVNMLYSVILSNQNAFGVQNILVPRGADVSISALSGGLNIIEANTQFGPIQPMNLTQTPKEIFDYLAMLEKAMETLSGVNSVTRGNPQPNLTSGTAMALIQSMSLQYMSGLQQSYVMMMEDIGTGTINMLKDFAEVPRIAMISGISNKSEMKEFTGDDLSSVNRVIVDIGNPLANTTAGRVEMAKDLLQMGVVTTYEQYYSVLTTGNLKTMTENIEKELEIIRDENERLVKNMEIIAIFCDNHAIHIKEHKAVLSDTALRFDPDLVKRTLSHIQEHVQLLRTVDPDILSIIGEHPLSPPGGSPANQAPPNMPKSAIQGNDASQIQGGGPTQMAQMGAQMPAGTPSPAKPPQPFQNLPTNPKDMPTQ